jgi:hypothetical protein
MPEHKNGEKLPARLVEAGQFPTAPGQSSQSVKSAIRGFRPLCPLFSLWQQSV